MKIGLIGAGRLGICLALLIEQAGYDVIASDVREAYVNELQNKRIITNEPDVQSYLEKSTRIQFTTDNSRVIKESDIIFTLVQTPSLEDGSYDVSAVWKVVEDFQQIDGMLNGKSLVVGCTTNPGDCEEFQKRLEIGGVSVYYNPEFIAQGSIIKDLQNADMVLVGGDGKHVPVLRDIYEKIQLGYSIPNIHFMSTKAAELTKIAVNCFLTTKVSYANQVGQVMIKDGLEDEVNTVLNAIGSDTRIGRKYLGFGFGFGGPCFPRDNRAFGKYAEKVGIKHNFGYTTDNFNNEHAKFIKDYFIKANTEKIPFLFESVAYKDGTDILTESQQYRLCLDLLDEGYEVYVNDDRIKDRCDGRIKFDHSDEHVFLVLL